MTFTIRDLAWLFVGGAGGALLIVGIDMWLRGRPQPRQVLVEEPDLIITGPKRLNRRDVEDLRRMWDDMQSQKPAIAPPPPPPSGSP